MTVDYHKMNQGVKPIAAAVEINTTPALWEINIISGTVHSYWAGKAFPLYSNLQWPPEAVNFILEGMSVHLSSKQGFLGSPDLP